jgi:hypothetical protein
VQIEIL